MKVIGDASLWSDIFPDQLIPEILDLVVAAWVTFEKPPPDEHEVPITKRFRSILIQHKLSRRLPIIIDREVPEDDLVLGEEKGRIDLRFIHGHRENVYFAFECKRLNVVYKNKKRESLANEYVGAGMMRFITSQYAANLNHGGMIAYVMDGDSNRAIKAVDQNINKYSADLKLCTQYGLSQSSFKPKAKQIKETTHGLPNRIFIIHHVFLPL